MDPCPEHLACELDEKLDYSVCVARADSEGDGWVSMFQAKEGTPVRERPWGKVLCVKRRGGLLRCDTVSNGWGRLESDFDEDGPLPEDAEEDSPVLEGWVLLDGRDLGLPRQTQLRAGEAEPPAEVSITPEDRTSGSARDASALTLAVCSDPLYSRPAPPHRQHGPPRKSCRRDAMRRGWATRHAVRTAG